MLGEKCSLGVNNGITLDGVVRAPLVCYLG